MRIRIAVILAALSLLQGCGVSEPDRQPVKMARFSFVCEYRNFNFEDTNAICRVVGNEVEIECPMMSYEERGVYSIYHYYKGGEADKRAFYALCEKNNDTRYDGFVTIGNYYWEVISPTDWSVRAIKNDIAGVEITSDVAWGESYPAGASLNDLFSVEYFSYAPFIDSGYADEAKPDYVEKPLPMLRDDDLRLLASMVPLRFRTAAVVPVPCRIMVKFRLATEQEATFTASVSAGE